MKLNMKNYDCLWYRKKYREGQISPSSYNYTIHTTKEHIYSAGTKNINLLGISTKISTLIKWTVASSQQALHVITFTAALSHLAIALVPPFNRSHRLRKSSSTRYLGPLSPGRRGSESA